MLDNIYFEFAKYTEITNYAFEINPNYKNDNYVRFFICQDVYSFWFARILKGYEYITDEGYIENAENYILEINKIDRQNNEKLNLSKVKQIIEEDDGSNWIIQQGSDIEKLVDMLDADFGIINRKEVQ